MDNKIRSLMGLLDGGKRIFQVADGEVDADQFEYCAVLTQILFGEKGLVETLGPAWEMVHDPRFEKIENLFVVKKISPLTGKEVIEGTSTQLKDGSWTGQFSGLQQYSEMLGEGRFLVRVLQSFAIIDAVNQLYPGREFHTDPKSSTPGLLLFAGYDSSVIQDLADLVHPDCSSLASVTLSAKDISGLWEQAKVIEPEFFITRGLLSPDERLAVQEAALTFKQYDPHEIQHWPDTRIWGLLNLEYPNYFSRSGMPNQEAKTLFAIIKGGLVGLVADFSEVSNVDVTVLLDDTNVIYDPVIHGEDAARVSLEIENLEKALTYRTDLRITAARILKSLGIGSQVVELTDSERDEVLKIIYTSKWPIEKTEMIMKVLGFMDTIRLSGLSMEQRQFNQLHAASVSAKAYVAGLKDGTILPVSAETDGTVEPTYTTEEEIMGRILYDPLFGYLFQRLTSVERKIEAAKEAYLEKYAGNDQLTALLDSWSEAAMDPAYKVITNFPVPDDTTAELIRIEKLIQARGILAPIFADASFVFSEEIVAKLDEDLAPLDPTTVAPVAQYEGVYDGESKKLEPTIQ